MLFYSPRERGRWLAAAALLGAIYLSLPWVRPLSDRLRDLGILRATMIAGFFFAAAGFAVTLRRARPRPGRREALALLPFAAIYLLILATMERAEEAFHFVEYGALAVLVHAALDERHRARAAAGLPPRRGARRLAAPAIGAVLITAAAGWLDEGIQHLLPERYYDLRDVVINTAAGVLAVSALGALTWARRRRRVGDR